MKVLANLPWLFIMQSVTSVWYHYNVLLVQVCEASTSVQWKILAKFWLEAIKAIQHETWPYERSISFVSIYLRLIFLYGFQINKPAAILCIKIKNQRTLQNWISNLFLDVRLCAFVAERLEVTQADCGLYHIFSCLIHMRVRVTIDWWRIEWNKTAHPIWKKASKCNCSFASHTVANNADWLSLCDPGVCQVLTHIKRHSFIVHLIVPLLSTSMVPHI